MYFDHVFTAIFALEVIVKVSYLRRVLGLSSLWTQMYFRSLFLSAPKSCFSVGEAGGGPGFLSGGAYKWDFTVTNNYGKHCKFVNCNFRDGSRGRVQGGAHRLPPPGWDDRRFSNTTGILQKKTMWFIGVEVEQETSAPPPKKNPGSAPDLVSKRPTLSLFFFMACLFFFYIHIFSF